MPEASDRPSRRHRRRWRSADRRGTRPAIARIARILWISALGALACGDFAIPGLDNDALGSDLKPGYAYEGRFVEMEIDPDRVIVAVDSGEAEQIAQSVLSAARVTVTRIAPMRVFLGRSHAEVVLLPPTTRQQAIGVRQLLRADPRVAFALTGYRLAGSKSPLRLLDHLGVQFRPGQSAAGIAAISRAYGVRLEGIQFFHYSFSFPRGLKSDPLAIALAVGGHPTVEWAATDMIAEINVHP